MANMGGGGIFTAMVIGIVIPEMMHFLMKNKIGLKLPPQVPDKIRQSFDLLIPIAFVILFIYPLSVFIYKKTGMLIPELIMDVFKPSLNKII